MKKEKYSSVLQLINLPKKGYLQTLTETIFKKDQPNGEEKIYVNVDIQKKRNQLIDAIQKQIEVYADTKYQFKFPKSKFPSVPPGEQNNITYEKKMDYQEEDTFQRRLSPEQIQQIKERGEFEVKSKMFNGTIPYVWKINSCILKGYNNRVQIWENGLAWCLDFFDLAVQKVKQIIPMGFKELIYIPVKFFALIFGKKDLTLIYAPNFEREVFKDFWTNIMENELKDLQNQIGHEFLNKLYLPYQSAIYKGIDPKIQIKQRERLQKLRNQKVAAYDQKKNKINGLKYSIEAEQEQFEKNWRKIRTKVLAKIQSENEDQKQNQKSMVIPSDQQPLAKKKKDFKVIDKLLQQKFLLYTAHLKENLPKKELSPTAIEGITSLILIFSLISIKSKAKSDKIIELINNTTLQIEQKHRIRSKNWKAKNRMVDKIILPIQKEIENEFYQQLLSEMTKRNYFTEKYRSIYIKFINLQKSFDKLVEEKKKNLKSLYKPTRVFQSSYILFPPYELLQKNGYYSLKKSVEMKTDTSTHFWKCSLYGMRFKCWNINCFKTLIGIFWASPLGFRCLFGIQDFVYDERCNSSGQKWQQKRTTVIGIFLNILKGIQASRRDFEALPDLGLFGKNCSRICNYIQCYVFRLLIVGVIGDLMIYPVVIILFSIITLIGIVTFWIWVPLAMLLCYLFNILVFQFEISSYNGGCLIKGIPLLSLVIQIFIALFKIIAPIILLVVIAPVICFIYFILLVLQRFIRTVTDTIMACLIGCLGRTPSRDTAIAEKISGPGMSRNYFYSISEQDVYILTQAVLEKFILNKFSQITRQQINGIRKKYDVMTHYILKPFGYSSANISNKVETNKQELMNSFNNELQNYEARYPNNPYNVRFTQQQIDLYFSNCVKIVQNFVEKENIQWIFDQKGILDGDYDQLTKLIWRGIFNCGDQIFEPLQRIDCRFKLLDDSSSNSAEMKRKITSIMKAVEGEVELNRKNATFSSAKRSILQADYQLSYISQINSMHNQNSENRIQTRINDPKLLLVAPRNLSQLKQFDRYTKETIIEEEPKIIQI